MIRHWSNQVWDGWNVDATCTPAANVVILVSNIQILFFTFLGDILIRIEVCLAEVDTANDLINRSPRRIST